MVGRKPSQFFTGFSWASQEHCLHSTRLDWDLSVAAAPDNQCCHHGKNLEDHQGEWSKAGWLSPANKYLSIKEVSTKRLHTVIPSRIRVAQLDFFAPCSFEDNRQDPGQSALKEAEGREKSICCLGTRGLQEQELDIYAARMPKWSYKGISHYHFASPSTEKP